MNKDALIRLVNEQMWTKGENDVPKFGAGDTITVTYRIVEGNKERLQSFRGVVIQIKGTGRTKMCRAYFPSLLTPHRPHRGKQVWCCTPCAYLLSA